MRFFLTCSLVASSLAATPLRAQPATDPSSAKDLSPALTPAEQPKQPDVAPLLQAPRSIKIKVLQKGTGGVLRKVEIRLGATKAFTDPEGLATIELPAQPSEVTFVKTGFLTSTLPWDEIKDLAALEIYLYPALGSDDEVIVRGKRRPSISKKVISSIEAARVAPGGDPGQVTKLMPGVTTRPGRPDVTIRGSKSSDSAYYLDDIKVPFIYHAIGGISVLPASIIEDVEFSAGGFGPEYGDATGGVVVLRSKVDIPEKPVTRFTLNLPLYSGIYHERPLSETSGLLVGTRRSYLDQILPKVLPKDSGVTVIPFFRDYQGIYTKKVEDGHYKLSLLASADGLRAVAPNDFSADENGTANFSVSTYFGAIAVERMKKLSDGWSMTTTPQLVYTDNKFDINDLKFRVRAHYFRLPIEFSQKVSAEERLYAGVDAEYIPFNVTFYLPKFDPDDPFYDPEEAPKVAGEEKGAQSNISGWVARDFKLGNGGVVTPGLRAFYLSSTKKSFADPRLQYRQSVGGGHTIKGAIGQYSQYPQNAEPSKTIGNPTLEFPRAYHYILGLETTWNERWDSDIQIFMKDVRKVIRNDPVKNYNNDGSLESYGFETFVRRALTERWFGWFAYTWSRTRERLNDQSDWYLGENDQTHVVNLAGSYRVSAGWDVGGRLGYHTGNTYTSKLGEAVYNSNLDKYQPRATNKANAARLPDYNEVSVYSGHDILFDTWKSTIRWGLEYFWFKRQAYGVRNNYDFTKEEYFKGIPPIPYLELRGEF